MKYKNWRRLLHTATAGSLGVSALCLAAGCIGIYRSGEFTPQAVAAAFRPIAWVVYLSLGLCLAGLFTGEDGVRAKGFRTAPQQLAKLRRTADIQSADPAVRDGIAAQQRLRKRLSWLRSGIYALCCLLFGVYALNGSHFHGSLINASMIRAMVVALPCLAVCLAACLWTARRRSASMEAELLLWKQVPKGAPAPTAPPRAQTWVRWALLGISVALLVYGYATGGTVDVLTKAVNICTECVGLG